MTKKLGLLKTTKIRIYVLESFHILSSLLNLNHCPPMLDGKGGKKGSIKKLKPFIQGCGVSKKRQQETINMATP